MPSLIVASTVYKMAGVQGLLSHIQNYCTKDGPGIRTTVFMIGCQLRCVWCANPEGMYPHKKLFYHAHLCKKCHHCCKQFPGMISIQNEQLIFNQKTIQDYEAVSNACVHGALEVKGQFKSVDQCVEELIKDKVFYTMSNGGVTFSGGEPFLQPEFLYECIVQLKKQDIHVAIETAGHIDLRNYANIVELVDLFLYDIKAYDDLVHKKCCQVSNRVILDNLSYLKNMKKMVQARLIIVPNYNDHMEDIKKRIDVLAQLEHCLVQIDILKYHTLGISKYKAMQINYPLLNMNFDDKELDDCISQAMEYAKKLNVKVSVGG